MRTNPARRRALNWGYLNAALWSVGNGLTTGTLIVYLAQDLGARGLGVSLVLAVPSLVGLLRLFSPAIIRRLGTAKRTCLTMYLAAYLMLAILPSALVFRESLAGVNLLAVMVGLICVHQLLEYIGTVALWSWLAELVPPRIRGRYFSRRQIWQLAVLIPTLWISGAFADHWRSTHSKGDLLGYALPIGVGVVFLLGSIAPLIKTPARLSGRWNVATRAAANWKLMLAPLADSRFRWWLSYGCWFSFFNGVGSRSYRETQEHHDSGGNAWCQSVPRTT
jgi:hypothetical protein